MSGAPGFLNDVEKPHHLKKATTNEKTHLPTKDEIAAEKAAAKGQ